MSTNPAQVGSGRPNTRRQSAIESSGPTTNKTDKSGKMGDKMKNAKETVDSKVSKDPKVASEGKDGKEKAEKLGDDSSKVNMAAEFEKLRMDMGQMFKNSEDKMSKMLKDSEKRMSDKLSTIELNFSTKIKELRDEVKTEMRGFKDEIKVEIENTKLAVRKEVDTMNETVKEMEKSVQNNSDKMDDLVKDQEGKIKAACTVLDDKLKELDNKLMLLEKQDRKYNLLFYGFQEEAGEDVFSVIRQSLILDLKLDEERVRNMYFAAGHRVPTKGSGPKPIIIRCTSLVDRELILSESKHYGGKRKRVVIDLPKTMKEERSALAKKAYEIRHSEDKQTRIRDKGLEVFLEVRTSETEKWVKRPVAIEKK